MPAIRRPHYPCRLMPWDAVAPTVKELRAHAGAETTPEVADAQSFHAVCLGPDERIVATARLQANGRIDGVAVLATVSLADCGPSLLHTLAEQAHHEGVPRLFVALPSECGDWLTAIGFTPSDTAGEWTADTRDVRRQTRLEGLEGALLGETRGHWILRRPEEYTRVLTRLVEQTERYLRLFSFDFAPSVFDHAPLTEAISRLARKSRYSDVRLLVLDPRYLTRRRHALIQLHRRLPSAVPILRVSQEKERFSECFTIADDSGFLLQPLADDEEGFASFNNRPHARSLIERFDYLWHRGYVDPELRRLGL